MFWVWIGVAVLVVIGLSVVIGKSVGRPKGRVSANRQDEITALKASGALRHRKSNRP